jgi:4-amino-4-deoxy-L-arabinose transferase-like glycosyltransferase
MSQISSATRPYHWGLLVLILLLALILRLGDPATIADGNTYYTASVHNMLDNTANFFFASADAGGVTVDKPPVALWIQAIFASVLGVSGFSVTLPSILAGVLSVALLYRIVTPRWGVWAGLLSALILALTPVAIAVDRTNNLDSILNLFMLLGTWAFLHATDNVRPSAYRLRWLLLGAVMIGIAFNVKMLQAYLILPALYGLYLLGANLAWRQKLMQLTGATLALLVVSFSWALVVDTTPADARPYVGGSDTNSVMELIIGYNGLGRLLGMQNINGAPDDMPDNTPNNVPNNAPPNQTSDVTGDMSNLPQGMQNAMRAGAPGGTDEIGSAGALRLFTYPLNNELGWLLPFALGVVMWLFMRQHPRLWLHRYFQQPLTPHQQALMLWGGWLVTGVVFFSVSSFYHAYYLATLAPPVAVLVALGITQFMQETRLWRIYFAVIAVATVFYQQSIVASSDATYSALTASALVMLLGAFFLWSRAKHQVALAVMALALLVAPASWSVLTAYDANHNTTLPSAYVQGEQQGQRANMPSPDDGIRDVLSNVLVSLTDDDSDVGIAVPSSMMGSSLVLSDTANVIYTGGFGGQDDIYSAEDMAQMVAEGEIRFFLTGNIGMPVRGGGDDELITWAQSACTLVDVGDDLLASLMPDIPQGAPAQGLRQPPQGAPSGGQGAPQGMPQGMPTPSIALYDCASR